jgi:amidase
VAVTANFAAAGLGTDTCGSVRLPAANNDLYGLRPTSGLSSRAGVIPFSTTLDAVGPMARSVVDLAIMLDATVGWDPADPSTARVGTSYVKAVDPDGLSGRRIGLALFTGNPEVEWLLGSAIEEMKAGGVEVIDVSLPSGVDIGPFFGELRFALDAYLTAEPRAPVRSLREIVDSKSSPLRWVGSCSTWWRCPAWTQTRTAQLSRGVVGSVTRSLRSWTTTTSTRSPIRHLPPQPL